MKLNKSRYNINLVIAFMAVILYGCIEPFEGTFEDFESVVVIEAVITDETKQQRVFITRTYEFEEDGPSPESNANVTISDDAGNSFDFQDTGDGIYVSTQSFAAQPNRQYQLSVTTQNGRRYLSNMVQLSPSVAIGDVSAERITTDLGEDGLAILVDTSDPTGNAKNFRYEYEETFRIISPTWNPVSLIGDPEGGCNVLKVPNTTDERVCYRTEKSNRIILASTDDLAENRIENFMVRFVNRNNYIISHRYSILVRQLVQSNEAFTFYETLNELSSSESLFSQIQPGFLEGNVFSESDRDERVLGFFDVSSVSEQRIFFNYEDFYPGEDLPPYVEPCNPSTPVIANMGGCVLRPIIESGAGIYAGDNPSIGPNEGPYLVVSRVCGDCLVLGTTEVPDFWKE
ncbi:DUF4249 domain-containing protein [Flagellimonas nanhaiensis]|uniref:DUF4249 domain-containing protein n=1 Tax=Flagellimonas nanhaiensis TaxID=2292706 RepID=A0A371JUB4_9FLAO|nr:DUF4249 domain-containing protein [Allomuricauda nanhaiensis]RDY61413.1 DUF4249 domain-containing protein [Allomuricauda nanhaiensis]